MLKPSAVEQVVTASSTLVGELDAWRVCCAPGEVCRPHVLMCVVGSLLLLQVK
jgi:hypothetical protein